MEEFFNKYFNNFLVLFKMPNIQKIKQFDFEKVNRKFQIFINIKE